MKESIGKKRIMKKIIFAISSILITVFILVICAGAYKTFSTNGVAAIELMDLDEQALQRKLTQLRAGMSRAQVYGLLGQPDRATLGVRPSWRVQNSPISQVAAYFQDGKLYKIRWLSLGRFTYEPKL